MNEKLNNYHFGRHVFDYFPWYKYSQDINTLPSIDDKVKNAFSFGFNKKFSHIYSFWFDYYGHITNSLGNYLNGHDKGDIRLEGRTAVYSGICETVNDWEDIEKIRLRVTIGKEEDALEYLSIIDFYNKIFQRIFFFTNVS